MKVNAKILTYSESDFNDCAAQFLKQEILKVQKKNSINIALSGGQSPLPVYNRLKDLGLCWDEINFFLVDERCVPNSDQQSNFGNLNQSFFKYIPSKAFPVFNPKFSIEQMAIHYENHIKKHVPKANGIPQFDLVILGMGLDGHTASLFPKTKGLEDDKNLVIANEIPQLDQQRITMTYPLLLNAAKIVLLAKGKNKKELLNNINLEHPISKIFPRIYKVLN